jgi:hypothetical protein
LITGVRYASAQVVYPRGTALIIGITSDESEICVNPSSFASFAASSSCFGNVYECRRTIAALWMPAAFAA